VVLYCGTLYTLLDDARSKFEIIEKHKKTTEAEGKVDSGFGDF